MDARAFGAHEDRTERVTVSIRAADVVFVAVCWLLTTAAIVSLSLAGLRAPFVLFS